MPVPHPAGLFVLYKIADGSWRRALVREWTEQDGCDLMVYLANHDTKDSVPKAAAVDGTMGVARVSNVTRGTDVGQWMDPDGWGVGS